ncbi:MAG: hypothetical protein HYR56_19435 [Acidobacteria bacterium]|nr:hypothetical protein [Acidobacteriota bacterium]MBI3424177.1 hypothetical protein [Acidobacteriota bacterium]
MTNESVRQLIQRNVAEKPMIRTEDGLAALAQLARRARKARVHYALCGGLAMHLYGFSRATTDVDVLASAVLDLTAEHTLSFGGDSYLVKVKGRAIIVDWIVRNDFLRQYYEQALADAVDSGVGHPILSPEWLVIIKYMAGRAKDQLDLLWLLRQPDLVDRALVKRHLQTAMGEAAYFPIRELERVFLEADTLRLRDEADEGKQPNPLGKRTRNKRR